MRTLLIIALTLITTISLAQNTVTWIGGTPGKATKWEEPKNWSNHRVPNDFSNVIIPDVSSSTFAYPEITKGIVEVNSIHIESQSRLTVHANAQLIIYEQEESLAKLDLKSESSLVIIEQTNNNLFCANKLSSKPHKK